MVITIRCLEKHEIKYINLSYHDKQWSGKYNMQVRCESRILKVK